MNNRTTFGRKNIGHPFRIGLAPHVLQPVMAPLPLIQMGELVAPEPRGHSFRLTLPDAVLRVMPAYEPEVALAMERAKLRSKPLDPGMITPQDVKEFLLAYCACFLAVLAFIS